MKHSLIHLHLTSLFKNRSEMERWLRSVKQMPQPGNTHPGKLEEDYGLFVKEGNWNLLYYTTDDAGQRASRMLSLKTQDVYLCRAVRDSVMAVRGLLHNRPTASGLRGARWASSNPTSLDGVKIVVYVRGPERSRKFTSTGDTSSIEKAVEWRTKSANEYIQHNDPLCLKKEKR